MTAPATSTLAGGRADFPLAPADCDALVRGALEEDRAFDDATTLATVGSDSRSSGTIVARAAGVIAGLPVAIAAFRALDPSVAAVPLMEDGRAVDAGAPLVTLSGATRPILSAERVALNFLQRLSGIATLTARYVEAVRGTAAKILDTRKTTPGLRAVEKYAVRCGGGVSHRANLAEAVLIKDNHIAASGGDVAEAVHAARRYALPGATIEVECDTLTQVMAAADAGVDIILLDNMTPDELRAAVALVAHRALTEASGGVRLETVRAIAEAGVDRISVGALTHSAPALDIGLDLNQLKLQS